MAQGERGGSVRGEALENGEDDGRAGRQQEQQEDSDSSEDEVR